MENSDTGRVIVGVGRSPSAYQALRYAVGEARLRNARLIAVRAFWSTAYARGLPGETPAWAAVAEADTAIAEVELAFSEALGGLPADISVEIIAQAGATARTLVSLALRESDLLVIGGCDAGRLSRFRRMGVARFCALQAACPVVIVPPTSLARSASEHRLAREVADSVDELLVRHGRKEPM